MHKETGASLVIAVVFAGCVGIERPAQSSVVVTDSAGITIVANGVLDDSRNLLASSSPALQLGVVAGAEEMQLYRVADVKRLSDGAIAVANGGSRELRIYNADGSHRATAGGAGRGPSEFGYPSSVTVLPGDTIQVEDFMDRVYFTANGDYVRRESADRGALAALWAANGGSSEGGSWLADGTFFAPVYHWDQKPPSPGPLARPNMTLVRISADLATVDTLGEFGGILAAIRRSWGRARRGRHRPSLRNEHILGIGIRGRDGRGRRQRSAADRAIPTRWIAHDRPMVRARGIGIRT